MSVKTATKTQGQLSEDVYSTVKALKEASHELPRNPKHVETLVERLKWLQIQGFNDDPKLRSKITSLWNLITQLEPQLERARRLSNRRGLKYILSRAKGKVLGNDITNVASNMESEIQLWLDRQNMENLVKVVSNEDSPEEEIVNALCGFEDRVREGYNPELQDMILSLRVFDSLSSVLRRRVGSPRVQKEAAFALAALVHFNKDVFVGQIFLSGVVESLLGMLDGESEVALAMLNVIGSLVGAGKGAVVDEIHVHGGVRKIVGLLEDGPHEMRVAAMDCVFEMAYYGRKEAVETMLDQGVVKKLAMLEHSEAGGDLIDLPMHLTRKNSSPSSSLTSVLHTYDDLSNSLGCSVVDSPKINSKELNGSPKKDSQEFHDSPKKDSQKLHGSPQKDSEEYLEKFMEDESKDGTDSLHKSIYSSLGSPKSGDEQHYSFVEEYWQKHPFASAVARFAIQLQIGQGLRQREKRALRQEILKRVKEAVPSDAEVATILAEILWGP